MSGSLPTNWIGYSAPSAHPPPAILLTAAAEAGRILLAATGNDRACLVRLAANRTGIALPDAERRVTDAITAATTAVQKAGRNAVILGFSTAVSLLVGAAAAWYASCVGGLYRDGVSPSLAWHWPQTA